MGMEWNGRGCKRRKWKRKGQRNVGGIGGRRKKQQGERKGKGSERGGNKKKRRVGQQM